MQLLLVSGRFRSEMGGRVEGNADAVASAVREVRVGDPAPGSEPEVVRGENQLDSDMRAQGNRVRGDEPDAAWREIHGSCQTGHLFALRGAFEPDETDDRFPVLCSNVALA
jgi:hypothetical protein